ncbi:MULTISPECIES: lipopolysaccharide biosynthesis protein [unclassified Microbacterium]|uniref:lipopolysaccharide biosynthesis protein n=1 Tax=Microbacterium TaxID=33882 RepID=UPI003BA00562
MSTDDIGGRALRGMGWVAAEKWGVRLVSLAVFAVLTRTVAHEAFGLLSLTTVFIAILMVFVDSGFAKSLVQKPEIDNRDTSTAFWTSLGIAALIYVVLFFAAPLIAAAYAEPTLTPVLRVMGLGLFVNAASGVPAALLERNMDFRVLSLRSISGTMAGAAISIPLALSGAGVWALVAQTLGTLVASAIALWLSSEWRPQLLFSVSSLRAMISFGMSILGLELMNAVQANVDKLLIGTFLGSGPLGIYFIAQRLLNIITELMTTVIGKLALTTFSRLQSEPSRLRRAFLQMTFGSAAVAVPVFAAVALLAEIIVPYVFGPNTMPSVPVMQVLAISAAFASIVYFDKNTLLAVGQAPRAFTLGLIENVVGVVLLLLCLPYGLLVVAIGRAARLFVVWPWRLWLLHRHVGIDIRRYLSIVIIAVSSIVPSVLVYLLLEKTAWRMTEPAFWTFAVPVGIIIVTIYALTLAGIAREDERAFLKSVLRRIRKK